MEGASGAAERDGFVINVCAGHRERSFLFTMQRLFIVGVQRHDAAQPCVKLKK